MEKWVICVEVNTLSTDSAALFLGRALEIFPPSSFPLAADWQREEKKAAGI